MVYQYKHHFFYMCAYYSGMVTMAEVTGTSGADSEVFFVENSLFLKRLREGGTQFL